MNDDRKFRERAETMKQLFLAHIPTDVIAKIAGISRSTVEKDRIRVAKLYGIKVPGATSTPLERDERFRMLLETYLTVKFKTDEWEDPLYQAAKLLIDFDRIENHIRTIENFYDGVQRPRFSTKDSMSQNYQHLIEDCLPIEDCYFLRDFYYAIYSGVIPYKKIREESDLIKLATKFCCDRARGCINTLVIDDPKAVIDPLISELSGLRSDIIRGYYGLDCEKKTLDQISNEVGLKKGAIRQNREKSLGILKWRLENRKYLIFSTAKIEKLEYEYAELLERYKQYSEETDREILELKSENAKLRGVPEKHINNVNEDSPVVQALIQPVRITELPTRIKSLLHHRYILNAIEDWEKLKDLHNFGEKSYVVLENYLLSHGINRHEISLEEKVLARQLIKRME
jgi:hypothetical protein